MNSKVAMVTGATSGIGRVTARELARRGYAVVLACRNPRLAEETSEEIRRETGNDNIHILVGDFASLNQVRQLATRFGGLFNRLDILVNNAGYLPGPREITPEGLEKSFCVNYLSHFLLTNLLHEFLMRSSSARIINLSSVLHRWAKIPWDDLQFLRSYGKYRAYSIAKLANVMFTHELAKRLSKSQTPNITVNAVHPGSVASSFGSDSRAYKVIIIMLRPFLLTPEQGAEGLIYLATAAEVEGVSGKYFQGKNQAQPSRYSLQDHSCQRLWEVSEKLTQLQQGF